MFLRQNFDILYSFKEYGQYEEWRDSKYPVYDNKLMKTFIGYSHVSGNSSRVEIFERFLSAFKLYENSLFGDARYAIELSKKKWLKTPKELQLEKNIEVFRDCTVKEIKKVNKDPNYVTIRNAACARLTLLNAKRFACFKHILYSNYLHLIRPLMNYNIIFFIFKFWFLNQVSYNVRIWFIC